MSYEGQITILVEPHKNFVTDVEHYVICILRC